MDSQLFTNITTVLVTICGIALVAVLVSNNAQTANVIQAGGNAFSASLMAAVSPVTGNTPNVSSSGSLGSVNFSSLLNGNSATLV
jgi:hypothetical protein